MRYAALLLLLPGVAAADNYAPQVGTRHRSFVLPNIADGKPVSLKDYAGRKLLLFHFASW